MFFVFVCYCYFASSVIIKAGVVGFLDRLLFLYLLESVGSLFIMNDVDGIDRVAHVQW